MMKKNEINAQAGYVNIRIPISILGNMGKVPKYVRGGIPIPRGVLNENTPCTVYEDGVPIPVQTRPMAFWPDRSVKWLLLDFKAREGRKYELVTGIKSPETEMPVKIKQNGDEIHIDTGAVRVMFKKDGSGFIDGAWLKTAKGEKEIVPVYEKGSMRRSFMDYFRVNSTDDYPSGSYPRKGQVSPSNLIIDTLTVEEQGPVTATVLIRGWYENEGVGSAFPVPKDNKSAFTLRIRFFAGEATIYAQHTFVYEGEPYTDFIGGIGLTLPLGLHPDKKRRVTTVGGETRREAWIYANPLFGYDPPEIPNPGGDYPFWKQGGLLQDTDGSYLIWKCWDRKHARLVMDRGQKAPGWIHISDQETGAAIVMPDMWKIYPKELYASNEEGYLTAYFYPESLPPLDLRRYAPIFGTGESESYGPGQATGVSRTHEIFIFFNEGSPLDKAVMDDIEAKAVGLSGKTVLFVDPEWYVSTNVVGEFAVADTGKFPVLDKLIADSTNFMLVHRNTYRWFGFFDYGDFQSIYRYFAPVENEVHLAKNYPNLTDNLRWMNDWGRWGWVNDEGLITFWLFIQFFRTGDYAVFEAANACACHVRDVDTAHTKEYYNIPDGCMEDVRGKGKRHNVQHWGDGYFGTRVSIPIAQRLQYYMTGDGRTRDVMDEVYECSVNRMEPDWVSDSIATSLYSIFARWEMTGEEKYGKMLDSYIKACLEYQQKNNGVFPYNATFDFEKGKVISFKGNHHSMFWHAFGMTNFLLEYYFLTKDPDLAKGLIRLAETTLEFDKTARAERWFRYYLYNQIYAAGYMLTKREDFKEQILKNIKLNLGDRRFVPKNPEHWIGEKAKVGPKTISMIGFAMAGLPYAMAAIGDEGPDMVD